MCLTQIAYQDLFQTHRKNFIPTSLGSVKTQYCLNQPLTFDDACVRPSLSFETTRELQAFFDGNSFLSHISHTG
jgi:hypothetical protein